jgi:RHS repeat-associated protein
VGEVKVWTITTYDDLGRVVDVKTPDNAKVTTGYNNDVVTVTDQTGRDRESTTDALGRLVKVVEDPGGLGYETSYTYDALDNLLKVQQKDQPRTFEYDSLSRLKSATNPESGKLEYRYDDNGNLIEKQDARLNQSNAQVTISYSYDKLNRVTSKSYNDGTPNVSYFYDAVPTSGVPSGFDPGVKKGQLVSVTYGAGGNGSYYGHDALGRVTQSVQKTDGISYAMTYGYDLANNLTSEGYPSGRVVKTTYDLADRISSVTGVKDSRTSTYASQFYYALQGAVSKVRLGNGLWEHTTFNTRLQPTEIGLGISATDSGVWKLSYKYGELVNGVVQTVRNNGNVASQTISVPKVGTTPALTLTQSCTYDEVNRLDTAQEKKGAVVQWQQVFKYDRYGNRTFDTSTGQTTAGFEGLNPSISSVNNQISKSGYQYDAVGNMTLDELDHTYQYDAENHLKSYDGGVGAAYTYDGEGHRVKKVTGNGTLSTIFVYDAEGKLVAEYATNTAGSEVGTRYLTQDALGSTRVVTATSSKAPTALTAPSLVKSRSDYLPFGEEIKVGIGGRTQAQGYLYGSGVADNNRQKFTGKERDDETGLDYFVARYYAAMQGRFISPDPVAGSILNPQSFNAYSYVWNNPLKLTDPTGMIVAWEDSKKEKKKGEAEARTVAQRKYENRIADLLNSKDPKERARGERLQATYQKLKDSDATFHVVNDHARGASSGELEYRGQGNFYVNLKGDPGLTGALSDLQRIAHEFKHGEQVLDGQLGYMKYSQEGDYGSFRLDRHDEAEAFAAGADAEGFSPVQRTNPFLNDIANALPHGEDAVVSALGRRGSPYKELPSERRDINPADLKAYPGLYAVPSQRKY